MLLLFPADPVARVDHERSIRAKCSMIFPDPSAGDMAIRLKGTRIQGPIIVDVRTADRRCAGRATIMQSQRSAHMYGLVPDHFRVSTVGPEGYRLRNDPVVQAR